MLKLRLLVLLAIAGCGSSSPPATQPTAPPSPAPVADAAVDAAPDALPDALLNAPAWIFRYSTADRKETWTLRRDGGAALLIVESAQGERRYVGTARESDASIALDVSTGSAKMVLDCKREKLAVSATCNDKKAKPLDVLNCYHADFKTPMPFGPAPGIEYVVDASCNGYRKVVAP
ncbi:MAG TPA: hypothetical protein VFV99_09380 [Kofleriaceae bacterium]|nr:hypothetical protein [Kofleriaceae bacterium]